MIRQTTSILLALLMLTAGCSSLLPSERAEALSPFHDYADAELRFAQATPGKTTRNQLAALGFDPLVGGNGKLLSFIDVRLMFVQPNVPIAYLPEGLLQCLEARDRCSGYSFEFSRSHTERVGNFWADLFNFRKKRQIHSWRFQALFVMVDDLLVHKVSSGEPNVRRYESRKNPLGPLQGVGNVIEDQL